MPARFRAQIGLTFIELAVILTIATYATWATLPSDTLRTRALVSATTVETTRELIDALYTLCSRNLPSCWGDGASDDADTNNVGDRFGLPNLAFQGLIQRASDNRFWTLSNPYASSVGATDADFQIGYQNPAFPGIDNASETEDDPLIVTFYVPPDVVQTLLSHLPSATLPTDAPALAAPRAHWRQILVTLSRPGTHRLQNLMPLAGHAQMSGPLEMGSREFSTNGVITLTPTPGYTDRSFLEARDVNCDVPWNPLRVLGTEAERAKSILTRGILPNGTVCNNILWLGQGVALLGVPLKSYEDYSLTPDGQPDTAEFDIPVLQMPGFVRVGHSVWARYFNILSDERTKFDIVDLDADAIASALDSVKTVYYKSKNTGEYSHGFIAQDVNQHVPELVSAIMSPEAASQAEPIDRENPPGTLGVNYAGFLPLLVASLRDQEQEMASIQARLDELAATQQGQAGQRGRDRRQDLEP